jgi:hypothetical protein
MSATLNARQAHQAHRDCGAPWRASWWWRFGVTSQPVLCPPGAVLKSVSRLC